MSASALLSVFFFFFSSFASSQLLQQGQNPLAEEFNFDLFAYEDLLDAVGRAEEGNAMHSRRVGEAMPQSTLHGINYDMADLSQAVLG